MNVIRASTMDRRLSCHGSATVEALVDPRDGVEGYEGVMGHWMIADRAIRELGATAPEGGLPPPQVPKGYRMPANSLWMVDWAIRHIRETIPEDWSLEVECGDAYNFKRWTASGHQDLRAISPDGKRLKGKDWKFVHVPVDPAEENEQVLTYLVINQLAFPALESQEFEICQPRVTEEDGIERVSSVTLDGERLKAAPATLDARVCEALDDPMTLNTGPKQCKWCVGCSCPAIRAEQKLMKMKLTPEILATIKRTPDDAVLADFVVVGRMLAKPLEDATEMLHKRIEELGVVTSGSGATITVKKTKGSIEVVAPVPFYQKTKELLVTDERMAVAFKGSKSRIIDGLAEAMNINKGGAGAVTATSVYEAHLAVHTKQGERRTLQIT